MEKKPIKRFKPDFKIGPNNHAIKQNTKTLIVKKKRKLLNGLYV